MIQIPDNQNAFLDFDDVVALNTEIKTLTSKIITTTAGETDRARLLFNWVRDNIPHSKDINSEIVTCSAPDVLAKGTGICFAKAHLLAAMMRYAKIPCGFCYQIFQNPENLNAGPRSLHGLNAVFMQETNAWHRIDPRGNREDVHAEFSLEKESLAFPELDFLDNCIYAQPLNSVVNSLNNATSISSLWPMLPTA